MYFKILVVFLAVSLLASCAYIETVFIPTAQGGRNPISGCSGNDQHLEVKNENSSMKTDVFQYKGDFVTRVSFSLDSMYSIDFERISLTDVDTGNIYPPILVEKTWYSESGCWIGPCFNTLKIDGSYKLKNATFYMHFPKKLRKSNNLVLSPIVAKKADEKSEIAFPNIKLNRVKRVAWIVINC